MCSCSYPPCVYYVAMSTSIDEFEASIAAFSAPKERDAASSPSPLPNSIRSESKYLFAVSIVPPFASLLHAMSCNERFQRRAGSINQAISTCGRGRHFPVAFCTTNKGKSHKQVIHFCVQSAQFRLPIASHNVPFALPATRWKHQSSRLYLWERMTFPRRLLPHKKRKESLAGNLFLCIKCPTSPTSCMK